MHAPKRLTALQCGADAQLTQTDGQFAPFRKMGSHIRRDVENDSIAFNP